MEKRKRAEESAPSRKAQKEQQRAQKQQARETKERKEREAREMMVEELEAEPINPIRLFCLQMDEMPNGGALFNYGFGKRDLAVAVPAPNDVLEKVNSVALRKGFSYLDLAAAVQDAYACKTQPMMKVQAGAIAMWTAWPWIRTK